MAVEVFGDAVDRVIGAVGKRGKEIGGGKGVVYQQLRAMAVRQCCQRFDIGNFEQWIGNRFDDQRARFDLPERFFHRC